MMIGLLKRAMPVCLVILASCDGSVPSEPGPEVPLRLVAGDYELIAAGETFSNTWTPETVRFEGILRIEQDPITPSKLSGTFLDLRVVEGGGLAGDWNLGGVIVGSIDANGSVLIELKTVEGGFTWAGRGLIVDSQISGQWTVSGWAAGGFTARLKPADLNGPSKDKAPAGFSHLEVSPAGVTLLPGESFDVVVVPRDSSGNRTTFPAQVRYSSSAADVAIVSATGVVTAVRPGTAEITADVSSDGIDRKATMRVTVVEDLAHLDIDGVYDVDAPVIGFDEAWGDFTGYRYRAVITVKLDEQGRGIGGTFTDFQFMDAAGRKGDWLASGTLRGEVGRDGKITMELTAETRPLVWSARGTSAGNAIEGTWGAGGHLWGTFRAVRRTG